MLKYFVINKIYTYITYYVCSLLFQHLQRAQLESANMLFQPGGQRPPSSALNSQRDSRPSSSAHPALNEIRPETAGSGDIQLDFQLDPNTPSASRYWSRSYSFDHIKKIHHLVKKIILMINFSIHYILVSFIAFVSLVLLLHVLYWICFK